MAGSGSSGDEKSEKRNRLSGNQGRCSKQRSKKLYTPKSKCKYRGNRYTKADGTPKVDINTKKATTTTYSSGKKRTRSDMKIRNIDVIEPNKQIEGYRMMDMEIFKDVIKCLACPQCKQTTICPTEDESKRKGWASCLAISCCNSDCSYTMQWYTSKTVDNIEGKQGRKNFDVNLRAVYALRNCGVGHKGLEKISGLLNMPKPLTRKNYDNLSIKVGNAVEKVAKSSMFTAAVEEDGETDGVHDIEVTVDGTWQKRGFSSLNGVVALLSVKTGKVLDVETMSRHCKSCTTHEPLKKSDPTSYEAWRIEHEGFCNLNYFGSAPNMESTGALAIFRRSLNNYGLRYLKYFGDGDSNSFKMIEYVYAGTKVEKYECLGHYQKSDGNSLRKLRLRIKGLGGRQKKGDKVPIRNDGKVKKAKSRLTDSVINKLQNYIGIVLRSSCKTVLELRNALLASMFHVASHEDGNFHTYCPKTDDSWCQYQRDVINNTNIYKPGNGIANDVIKEIKVVYQDLTKDADLAKCLHHVTQNANESLNGLFWERVPKRLYCGINKMKCAVYDSVAIFNYGRQASIDIYRVLNMKPGQYTISSCHFMNIQRKYTASYKNLNSSKIRRKVIRGLKKRKDDSHVSKEGTTQVQ